VIVLDTNVVSTFMDPEPDPIVLNWLNSQSHESIWITTITLFEIRYGLELLPQGRRRASLSQAFLRLINEKLDRRVLAFDEAAAEIAASLAARRRSMGRPVETADTQIAGIVLSRRASLATRNVRHFADIDAPIINPWDD
jgi:hypothetical protein